MARNYGAELVVDDGVEAIRPGAVLASLARSSGILKRAAAVRRLLQSHLVLRVVATLERDKVDYVRPFSRVEVYAPATAACADTDSYPRRTGKFAMPLSAFAARGLPVVEPGLSAFVGPRCAAKSFCEGVRA